MLALARLSAPARRGGRLYNNNFNTSVAGNNTGTMTATTFITQATRAPSRSPTRLGDFALTTSDTDAANGRGSFGFPLRAARRRRSRTGPLVLVHRRRTRFGHDAMRIDNQTNNAVGSGTSSLSART
jgi:hypothetical protein